MRRCALFLPVEIVEKILRNVDDGLTLVRAGMVCSTWRAIVQGFTQKTDIWKEICQRDLSPEESVEIASQLYPASRMKSLWIDSNIDWHIVFKTTHGLKIIGKSSSECRKIYSSKNAKENINCVKLSGTCVLTGHEDGTVQIWSQDGVFLDQLALHQRPVTDIAVVSFFHELPSSLWDIRHEYVISTSVDHTIQINPICPARMAPTDSKIVLQAHRSTIMVRVHGDEFVAITANAQISVWSLTAPAQVFECPEVVLLDDIQQSNKYTLLNASLWSSVVPGTPQSITVTGICDTGRLMKVSLFPTDLGTPDANLFWTQQLGPLPILQSSFGGIATCIPALWRSKVHLWRDQVFVWTTGDRSLCISVDGELYKEFNTMPHLHGVPVAVLIFEKLFIMGLDSGAVVIYHFTHTKDLMNLDLGGQHHRVQMGHNPISSLALSVSPDATMLLGASLNEMHITCLL